MLFFDGGFGLLLLALWIFCIIDVITTPDAAVRNLPKVLWVIIVLLLPDIGSIVWLIAGHPWDGSGRRVAAPRSRESGRAGRGVPTSPDDDEAFLDGLRARAEEQRRRAREAKEREAGEDGPPAG